MIDLSFFLACFFLEQAFFLLDYIGNNYYMAGGYGIIEIKACGGVVVSYRECNPLNEALTAESVFMQKEIERRKYEQREKALMDYAHDMGAALDEGVAIGIDKGVLLTAKNMLAVGIDIPTIRKVTNLSEEEISKLLN